MVFGTVNNSMKGVQHPGKLDRRCSVPPNSDNHRRIAGTLKRRPIDTIDNDGTTTKGGCLKYFQ